MKQGPFLTLIADTLTQPVGSVKLYARELREAGLLTTGARGVNAPHMTALDAARLVLALLTTDKPSECVERVKRFGQIKYSPEWRSSCTWREIILPEEFHRTFEGEVVEDVLAAIFDIPVRRGVNDAVEWFLGNVFHLEVHDFDVRVELVAWKREAGKVIAERIVPFQGEKWILGEDDKPRPVEGFTPIKGGVSTTRVIAAATLSAIAIGMTMDAPDG